MKKRTKINFSWKTIYLKEIMKDWKGTKGIVIILGCYKFTHCDAFAFGAKLNLKNMNKL